MTSHPGHASTQRPLDTLALGEVATINGHVVARVGLCLGAMFTVDGEALDAVEAAWAVMAPVVSAAPVVAVAPVVPQAPPVVAKRPTAAPRPRASTSAVAPRPELVQATMDALVSTRGVTFAHRAFAGGEAVTVAPVDVVGLARLRAAGLHAERATDGAGVVVAWNRAALHGGEGKRTGRVA